MGLFSRRQSDRAVVNIVGESRPQCGESASEPAGRPHEIRSFVEMDEIRAETAQIEAASRLVFHTDPRSVAADRFRYLRMRLRQLSEAARLRSILITSAVPQDGKSTTALNLATALAEEGKRAVLLIEADLHQPTLRKQLGLANTPGLAECLENGADAMSLVRRIDPLGFCLLSAGEPRGNPTELLQSDALAAMMPPLLARFDWVLFDSPPLTPLTDALVLARQTDASLLVVRAGKSPRALVEKAFEQLGRKHVLGIILNELPGVDRVYSKYYGSYGKKALLEPGVNESAESCAATQ